MLYPLAMMMMGGAAMNKGRQDREDGEDRRRKMAQEDEDRAFQREDREFARSERQRAVANRNAVAAAAAPEAIADGTVYQPEVDDEGNLMPANPTAGTFKVGEKRFADRATAETAANDPVRKVARMSAALEKGGDIAGAQALRTGYRQEQTAERQGRLADLQLDEHQEKFLNKQFDATLGQMTSFDDLANFITKGNGSASGITLRAQPSADGKKTTLVQVMPDGSTKGTNQTFDNTPQGLERAKASFSKSVGPQDKMTWLHQQAVEAQQAAQMAQTGAHQTAMFAETSRHNRASEGIARMQANTAASKAAAGAGPAQLSLKDMRDFEDDVFKRLGPEFDPKNAIDDAERAKVTAARNAIATRASGVFRINGERGQPITAEVALNALQLAGNRANVRELPANDGKVYPVVLVNGAPVIVGPGSAPKAPAAAPGAPNPWASAPPGGGTMVDGKVVQQGSQPAAPAAAAPGQKQPFQQFLAQNITTPQGKQAIAQRIQQELPVLQSQIDQDTRVMALPAVSGAVKAKLKQRVEAAAQEVEMMTTFLAGNVGV